MRRNSLLLAILFILLLIFTFFYPSFFFFLIIPVFILIGFYFNRYFDKSETERIKQSFLYTKEELDADKWMEQEFAPRILAHMKRYKYRVIAVSASLTFAVLFLWESLFFTMHSAIFVLFLYICIVCYIVLLVWFYGKFEKTHKKMNNIWLRGYFFLVPPITCIWLMPSGIRETSLHFLFSVLSYFFLATFAYFLFFVIISSYLQITKENRERLETSIKNAFKEE